MARPKQISDEAILEEARVCFLAKGLSVSTVVIAENLGISQATLFKRFKSKKNLMIAALGPPPVPEWALKLEMGPDGRSFEEQFREFVENGLVFFSELMPRITVLSSQGISPEEIFDRFDAPPPLIGVQKTSAWLSRCHKNGLIRDVDFDSVAIAIIGSLTSPNFLNHILGNDSRLPKQDHYIAQIVDLYVRSLVIQGEKDE